MASFAELEEDFMRIVRETVFCTAPSATVTAIVLTNRKEPAP
jgi:hypothetical protein